MIYLMQNMMHMVYPSDNFFVLLSYLKRRKQGVKILGPILFNIIRNDLFLFIKDVELSNFADDNTIYAARNSIPRG